MKLFRLLARRAGRVGAIVALSGAILGFGHFMTPRPPSALARVYQDLGDALAAPGVPEYMKLEVEDGAVQEVSLNGNTLFYTQYRTDKSIPQLLDYYQNLYKGPEHLYGDVAAREEILKTVKDKESRDEQRRRIEATETLLNERYIRFQGKGWGGFSTIVAGDPSSANYTNEMLDRFRAFKKTGLVKDLGDPKIVVAFDDPSRGDVQYFNVWPGDDFDQRKVAPPKDGGDAAGDDLDGVPRPQGSRRTLSFAQEHGDVAYQIAVYENAHGDADSTLAGWYTAMDGAGWSVSGTYEAARNDAPEPLTTALWARDGFEAFVSVRDHEDGRVTSTVILQRR